MPETLTYPTTIFASPLGIPRPAKILAGTSRLIFRQWDPRTHHQTGDFR
jgi:hypothetical protein